MKFYWKSVLNRKAFTAFIVLVSTYFIGFIIFNLTCPHLAIINRISRDRLGDQIIIYSKAKWLAYKYKIPFLLVPFEKSNQLNLFYKEKHCSKLQYNLYPILYTIFGNYVKVRTEKDITNALNKNSKLPTLFISRIGTKLQEHLETDIEYHNTAWINSMVYELMILNPDFAKNLKYMLQPKDKIEKLTLPKDKITVAVHVRKGGGFDPELKSTQYYNISKYNIEYKEICISKNNPNNIKRIVENTTKIDDKILASIKKTFSDQGCPEKFPPEQYYVEQIKKLSHRFNNKPIYIHIFTDDNNPKQIKKRIKNSVNLPNIKFAYNKQNTSIVQDYCAMAEFDCLIRSMSGFAYLSQLLGNHKIIIYPIHMTWINPDILVVDKIGIIKRDNQNS
ncbi:hypothetical protein GF322_00145 [Candidatus Dependentiae bacterium]|nr:hypothetical protein [Candidatus Dependentiae bacterium]